MLIYLVLARLIISSYELYLFYVLLQVINSIKYCEKEQKWTKKEEIRCRATGSGRARQGQTAIRVATQQDPAIDRLSSRR